MTRFLRLIGVAIAFLPICGCQSGGFGSDLAATPRSTAVSGSSATLSIPKSSKFSIAVPISSRQPGLDGKADASSSADAAGSAAASAAMEGGGKAQAGFQLGHAFKNDSATQADFEFTVRFHCEYDAAGDPNARIADASVALMLYGRDGRNRLVREQSLTAGSSEAGPIKRTLTDSVTFTITVGAGETATVYLAGEVKIETPDKRSARGNLKLSDAQIDVVTHPAPAVAPKSAGQK